MLGTTAEAVEAAETQPGRTRPREVARASGSGHRRGSRCPQFPLRCRADRVDQARASRAGRAVSGLGRAAGPAGPRTRPVPAGQRCGCLGSADAAGGLAPRRPGGPRVRHVTGFCLRGDGLLAKSCASALPLPVRGPVRPSRGPKERHFAGLCLTLGAPSIHLFIPSSSFILSCSARRSHVILGFSPK